MNAVTHALPARRWILDLAASAVLLLVALAGFWPTFGGGSFVPAAIGGVVLGLGIAAVCVWRRWGILALAGLTVAAYALFGGALALGHTAIAGIVPTLETFRQLGLGVVTSWKKLLTTVAPVATSDGHLLVPLLVGLLGGVLTGSLALRLRRPSWALIPATAALALVIAMGMPDPAWPVAQGVIFALVSIIWLAVRQRWAPENTAVSVGDVDPARAAQLRWRRIAGGAAVLAVAGGAGVAASAVAAPETPRYVFRDVIIPPFDIREYASPLQSFRGYVRDAADETLFTVQGLPEGARVRLGVMDEYNGVVYNVTDGGLGTSSAFTPLRGNMSPDADGLPVTLQIEVGEYDGVWLPGAGAVSEISFEGETAEDRRRVTYFNEATNTGVSAQGLASGDRYTVQTRIAEPASDEDLEGVPFGKVVQPRQENVPDDISSLAADAVAEARTPIEQVRALETFFSEEGFFSHGLEGEVLSRAGHGTERITTLLGGDQMIGDDEQYATTMALMARELGIPARVVMGFYPDEDESDAGAFEATGATVHAWVEVNFAEHGWQVFDPTPPEDKIPTDQNTKPKADPKPQVLQPPPPPQEPVDLPPLLPDEREGEEEKETASELLGLIAAIGGGVLGILLILAAPFLIIGAWKASRRRARRAADRAADRISGGWDELTDRAIDYGARFRTGSTRGEEAQQIVQSLAAPAATALGDRADAEVFGPGDPSPEQIEDFWREVDDIVGGMGEKAGFWRRIRARLSLRALLADSALTRGVQGLRAAAATRGAGKPGTIENTASDPNESETA